MGLIWSHSLLIRWLLYTPQRMVGMVCTQNNGNIIFVPESYTYISVFTESLRLLSLHDNKYLRYFKGHHDRFDYETSCFNRRVTASACPMCKSSVVIFSFRVVSLSLCPRNECFISGSLDRTVLLWDQRAEKCQVDSLSLLNFFLFRWTQVLKCYLHL